LCQKGWGDVDNNSNIAPGGAALALTGGLAAPIVGHIFGVMGLSALATALTTTTVCICEIMLQALKRKYILLAYIYLRGLAE
jgi:hypothetical protein